MLMKHTTNFLQCTAMHLHLSLVSTFDSFAIFDCFLCDNVFDTTACHIFENVLCFCHYCNGF